MTQSYKTYSVRIPSGPVSDFVDASGNGVYLRKLFIKVWDYRRLKNSESSFIPKTAPVETALKS